MKITEKKLKRIIRNIIKEETSIPAINSEEQEIANDIVNAIKYYQKQPVRENTFKDIAGVAVDIGFRLFSFKATIPMLASAVIIYAKHKGIQPEALTIEHAQSIVNFIGLKADGGQNALQLIINVIAGIGGGYGIVKGSKIIDNLE